MLRAMLDGMTQALLRKWRSIRARNYQALDVSDIFIPR